MFRSYVLSATDELVPARVRLASGSPATLHADFVSAWDPAVFNSLIATCAKVDCGHDARLTTAPPQRLPAPPTVTVSDFAFKPGTVAVRSGGRVVWRWSGGQPHNVYASDGRWHSPVLTKGIWSRSFKTRGTFPYYCTIHPSMVGKVIVK